VEWQGGIANWERKIAAKNFKKKKIERVCETGSIVTTKSRWIPAISARKESSLMRKELTAHEDKEGKW